MAKRHAIPHALTLGNLLCGTTAMGLVAMDAPLWQAAALVGLGLIFDLFDGRAARSLGSDGAFGAQLDSLADMVSFGAAPAMVLYAWKLHAAGLPGLIAAGAIVAAAATRLARFTAGTGTQKKAEGPARFSGLAVTIPAAIILGSVAADIPVRPGFAMIAAGTLAALMVSSFPYRSFKDRSFLVIAAPATVLLVGSILFAGQMVAGVGLGFALGGSLYALSAPTLSLWRRVHSPKN